MTFLRSICVSARDADTPPDLLARLRADEIQAVVVDGVYTPEECRRIVEDLRVNRHGFVETSFPAPFKSRFLGINLNLAEPHLRSYFTEAARFTAALDALLADDLSFEARITSLLSRLDGGKAYVAAPGPQAGTSYMPTTFRIHDEGGYIPAHFDNEQTSRPSFTHLETLIRGDLLSLVLTLARADEGGHLEIFDATAEAFAPLFKNRDGLKKPDISTMDRVAFDVEAGTLLIVRSGDRLHRVAPVIGPTPRWTACSFMAEARDRDAVYLWG